MTNNEVMELFREADELRASDLSEGDKNNKINEIHSKIVEGLSFIVRSNTKKYVKFQNYNDLVQEGFVGLVKAVKNFNYKMFPNFFVYSEKWIKHHIRRAASKFDIVYNPDKNRVVYSDHSEIDTDEEDPHTPENMFLLQEASGEIEKVLEDFSDRDRDIIQRAFGLGEYNQQTLREIGPVHNLTHERVRQIKNRVISKLSKNSSIKELY